jgi:hypothetical protein
MVSANRWPSQKKYVVCIYLFIIFILGYYFYSRCSSFIGRTNANQGTKNQLLFLFYLLFVFQGKYNIYIYIKSRRGKKKNLTALKSNSNTVWFNFQTYIYIYLGSLFCLLEPHQMACLTFTMSRSRPSVYVP